MTPTAAGIVGLLAANEAATVATNFTAMTPPDVLRVTSTPAAGSFAGAVAALLFAVQVLLADGKTVVPGESVTMIVAAGTATLTACKGAVSCLLVSDASGMISTEVMPGSAGTITLQAVDGATTVTTSFTAVSRPDTLRLVSAPASTAGVGFAAPTAFAVQLLQGDGVTAEPGRTVVFSASSGSVRFGACGGPACSVTTAADGSAATSVTPLTAGPVTLVATEGTQIQTASFNAVAQPDVLRVISAPADGGYAGTQAAAPFTALVLLADGTTAAPGRNVTVTIMTGSATLTACGSAASCVLVSDASGIISTGVTPSSAGTITLQAADATATATATFTALARPDTLRLVDAPAGTTGVGYPAATAFIVQLLQADGATPDAGKTVIFSASAGSVRFGACGAANCSVVTGSNGVATTSVTPLAAGPLTLVATQGTLIQTASLQGVMQPDVLRVTSVPASDSSVGEQALLPFAVQALLADGVTPAAGRAITLGVLGGAASFSACGGTAPCVLLADSSGLISTGVIPASAGAITLVATDGQPSVSATFTAIAPTGTLTSATSPIYIAEGAAVDLILVATAAENGSPTASQPVTWSGSPALQPASASTLTDANGRAAVSASAGPLAAGALAQATACAWSSVCTHFTVIGVSAAQMQPVVVNGAAQAVTAGAPLQPVTVAVVDGAGHAIAGAPVTIYQTVTAYDVPCPVQGRCPAAPVLSSLVTVAVSDANGRYVFTPLTVQNSATQTEIDLTAGDSGYTTTTLTRRP